ncbi:MAG: HEAT repeat domain-containing protein [Spirochaetota bacterium]
MNKRSILMYVLIMLVAVVGFAQSEDAEGETGSQTIEELYLSQDVELQIIRGQALSNNRDTKLLALQNIRQMIEDGSLSRDNSGMFTLLQSLASEGTSRQVRSNGGVINNYPDIRRQAAQLLGEVGGSQAKDVLISVLQDDPEPMVLSEAVYALGKIGDNEDNRTVEQIVRVLQVENASESPDDNLAYASLLALEKIAESQGGLSDPDAINIILEVAGGSYIRPVRLKAVDVLAELRS